MTAHRMTRRRWESLPSVRVLVCGDGLVTRVAVLERELAAARAVVGPAWLTGGVSLADAIAAKCSMLERIARDGAR